jgi:hypothetical protein
MDFIEVRPDISIGMTFVILWSGLESAKAKTCMDSMSHGPNRLSTALQL